MGVFGPRCRGTRNVCRFAPGHLPGWCEYGALWCVVFGKEMDVGMAQSECVHHAVVTRIPPTPTGAYVDLCNEFYWDWPPSFSLPVERYRLPLSRVEDRH